MKGSKKTRALNIYTDLWADRYALSETDASRTQWVQYLPRGTFKHPRFGDLVCDDKLFNELKSNFDNRVRVIDPAIDSDHAPTGDTRALAWFKEVQIRPDGFWVLVEYTPRGFKLVHQDRELRYFSPEWGPYENPRTGETFDNVISGGAATNRPFLKELAPLAASEHWLVEGDPAAKEKAVPKQLGDNKTGKRSRASTTCTNCGGTTNNGNCTNCGYQMKENTPAPVVAPADLDKASAKASKALTEIEATNKKLADVVETQAKKLAEMETRLKASEVDIQLKEWSNVELTVELKDVAGEVTSTKAVRRAITPKLAEMYRGVMLGEKAAKALTLKDFIDEGIKGGFVTLGEIGDGLNPQHEAPDARGGTGETMKYLGETYAVSGADTVRLAEEWAKSNSKDFNDPVVKQNAFAAISQGERAASAGRSY